MVLVMCFSFSNAARLQNGFTLLELLVVVVILASLGGIASFRFELVVTEQLNRVVMMELSNIKSAILNFEKDTGERLEEVLSPANLGELFQKPEGTQEWDIATARGWRGPYLEKAGGVGYIDIGANLESNGAGNPLAGDYLLDVPAVADSFNHAAVFASDNKSLEHWYLNWVNEGIPVDIADQSRKDGESDIANFEQGRPYLVLDRRVTEKARVLSFGPNGIYEEGGGDDLVLCLYRSACSS